MEETSPSVVFAATHTLMVTGDWIVTVLGINNTVSMGCRKKAVHILPVPILFLHSCFSIFTCSAFKLQNNLRLSTFILYNSDADLLIN